MVLLQALRNATERLAIDFEDSKLFTHSGVKGDFREQIIERFLHPFLPNCYGIGTGQVFSADGHVSKQIYIIIYDNVFSNVLFRDNSNSLFPCESVYGTIEVKSVLSTDELEQSINNINSVKSLLRTPTDMSDVTPISRFELSGDITLAQTQASNPYLGIVFANDGLVPDKVCDVLNEHIASGQYPREQLPNFVFLYKRGATILRVLHEGDSRTIASPGHPFNAYALQLSGIDTLPLFFLTLNAILNSVRLRAPDFTRYWSQVFYQIRESNLPE
jgi:hypothetical protein